MGVDVFRFKVKKKIPKKLITQASKYSRSIKKEAENAFGVIDQEEIQNLIKEEMSYWKKESDGYTYIDDTVMSLLSLYPYLYNKKYISKLEKVIIV